MTDPLIPPAAVVVLLLAAVVVVLLTIGRRRFVAALRRPVPVAVGCQLAVAAILAVRYAYPPSTLLLVYPVFLAVCAVGLHRGSPVAYWLSLTGLGIPLIGLTLLTVIGDTGTVAEPTTENMLVMEADAPAPDPTDYLLPILAALTTALLLTTSARRAFRTRHP
ncbi:hypothetical protein [Actinoplanes couchii]|uniref:hypothetical protein n=1 Tax=Actinoplanes couchii TaxID=403638 RepID=UPI001944C104|nr:hypothetical protein [Actinoplanes couchii]MDR6317111.1 hypothetical protein [Actinoplanes couchii]